MCRAWVVRPYPHGIYRMQEFLDENMIAIGWPGIGDLSFVRTRDDIEQALGTEYQSSPKQLGQAKGNLFRFVREIELDDYVVVPDGGDVYFGSVTSDYKYVAENDEQGFPHQRSAIWFHEKSPFPRQHLTGLNWNTLKGKLSVFEIRPVEDVRDTVENKSHLFISPGNDRPNTELKKVYLSSLQRGSLRGVNSNTFEYAVCELLSKYYPGLRRLSTTNSSEGDTDLMTELPGNVIVRVQVKHFYPKEGDLRPQDVEQLAASMDLGDHGIIVTSGTIGPEAKNRASRYENINIDFIDGDQFVDLLFENINEIDDNSLHVFGLTRTLRMI